MSGRPAPTAASRSSASLRDASLPDPRRRLSPIPCKSQHRACRPVSSVRRRKCLARRATVATARLPHLIEAGDANPRVSGGLFRVKNAIGAGPALKGIHSLHRLRTLLGRQRRPHRAFFRRKRSPKNASGVARFDGPRFVPALRTFDLFIIRNE